MTLRSLPLLLLACACASTEPAPSAKHEDAASPQRWNGGKPHAPFQATASPEGEVSADVPFAFTVTLVPSADCEGLETSLRGADGVEVTATPVSHSTCRRGEPITHAATARVPAGTEGLAVVDVKLTAKGQAWSESRAFALRTPGARKAQKSTGTVVTSPGGDRVIELPSGR